MKQQFLLEMCSVSKLAKMSPTFWATFVKKCSQELSKVAQSGHTGGDQQSEFLALEKDWKIRRMKTGD